MSPGLFFSQKFQNVCAGLFFLRSAPKMAKIFWRFAPKHGDFAFKYDQKCPKKFRRFAPKYSDFAFKYDQKCSIFSGASRQNIAILPLNMVENAQNFPALRAGPIFGRGVIFFSKVFIFCPGGYFFEKSFKCCQNLLFFENRGYS